MPETNIIKKIQANGVTYEIYDEYARRRLEGLTNVYSISCLYTHASGKTYVDFKTGADVAYSIMEIYNGDFKSSATAINIPGTHTLPEGKTAYLVLTSQQTTDKHYVLKLTELELGDTVYVIESTAEGVTGTIHDRWLSQYTASPLSGTFTALDQKIDLSEYAKKGTYTSSAASASSSGEAGAATITSSSAGSTEATGSVTITYSKADAATGSANGSTAATTGASGAATITSSSAGDHTHTVELTTGSKSVVTGVSANTGEAGGHTHTVSGNVDSHTHGTDVGASKINSYTAPSMTTITFTQNGDDTWSAGSLPSWSAAVNDGILSFSWGTGTLPSYTQGSKATLTGGVFNAGTLTYSGVTAAGVGSAASLTISGTAASAGAHTHSVGSSNTTVTYATGVSSVSSAGAHTHSVTIADHSHSYNAPAAHTHSIGSTDQSASSEFSVAIGAHTHTVTISNHSHTIGHTHTTTI